MASAWLTIPSKRPAHEAQACVDKWRAMGYKVALHRDKGDDLVDCDYIRYEHYEGYARTTNALIREVLAFDKSCEWTITGGDDTEPDPKVMADVIARQCSRHFGACDILDHGDAENLFGTFGVMQPTGDRFADGSIDRIAGSPWIGREFSERMYGGRGPYWHEYRHMFVDEEIMEVAVKLGVFWQRPDLTHLHHHFMRASSAINSAAVSRAVPAHLVEVNSPAHWSRYQAKYLGRKASGFPGHEPLVA